MIIQGKKYKILFIDADDTLYDFRQCEWNALTATLRENGIEPTEEVIEAYHLINGKLWKDLEKGLIKQADIKYERYRLLCQHLGWDNDYMKLSLDYIQRISNERILLPGAEEICRYLAGKYMLVLLTNGISEIQRGRFESSVLFPYFSHMVISEEACCSKPDPGIFTWALLDLPVVEKEEMIIIGDSLSSDIQGGINFGIDTCWLNPGLKDAEVLSPTYIIRQLSDLKNIL